MGGTGCAGIMSVGVRTMVKAPLLYGISQVIPSDIWVIQFLSDIWVIRYPVSKQDAHPVVRTLTYFHKSDIGFNGH